MEKNKQQDSERIGKGIIQRTDLVSVYPTPKTILEPGSDDSNLSVDRFKIIKNIYVYSSILILLPYVAIKLFAVVFIFGAFAGVFLSFAIALSIFAAIFLLYSKIDKLLYKVNISTPTYLFIHLVFLLSPFILVASLLHVVYGELYQTLYLIMINFVVTLFMTIVLLDVKSIDKKVIVESFLILILNGGIAAIVVSMFR